MIFLGDLASPNEDVINSFKFQDSSFLKEPKIANLESLIVADINNQKVNTKGIALHSSPSLIEALQFLNVEAVTLANNHISDYNISIRSLRQLLKSKGISSFGAGNNISEAKEVFCYKEGEQNFVVVAFGWNVIGCKYAKKDEEGVNPLDYNYVLDEIAQIRKEHPNSKIIVSFHWNYEFEFYPQPRDRKLAHSLIDLGVEMIVGHHPHIVGSIEVYKGKSIFYSLGNFFIQETNYNGYNLKYNDNAKLGLAIKYDSDYRNIQLFWLKKDNKETLSIYKKEKLEYLIDNRQYCGTIDLSEKEYLAFFKKYRHKSKLLPIYSSNRYANVLFDYYVLFRNYIVNCMVKFNLKR